METALKKYLPEYEILNFSNKLPNELEKIIYTCEEKDKLLVYLIANKKNIHYFNIINKFENWDNIALVFLNKDNYYVYTKEEYNNFVLSGFKIEYFSDLILNLKDKLNS